jgi:pyruvate carboxylase
MPRVSGRPGASLPLLDFDKLKDELKEKHPYATDWDVMSAALYPHVTDEYLTFHESFGPVDKLDTRIFLTGPKVGEEFEVRICFICYLTMYYDQFSSYGHFSYYVLN